MERIDSAAVMPEAAETLTLYHGTSSGRLASILAEGLTGEPYLTSEIDLAQYYAETACEEEGGDPVILEVTVALRQLRYDRCAMAEPVSFGDYTTEELEEEVEEVLDRLAAEHPEWCRNGYLAVPPTAFRVSLDVVASCWNDGAIPPDQIRVLEV